MIITKKVHIHDVDFYEIYVHSNVVAQKVDSYPFLGICVILSLRIASSSEEVLLNKVTDTKAATISNPKINFNFFILVRIK